MSERHRIPVIEKMIDVLFAIEQNPDGITINDIVADRRLPRSTVYRILNTLEAAEIVVSYGAPASYVLGPRILGLAANVPNVQHWNELVAKAHPLMSRLSQELGETVKLSVLHDGKALCIACVRGQSLSSLNGAIGQRFPLHAGAASKILLSGLTRQERRRLLPENLPEFTPHTIREHQELEAELESVLANGWAEDRCEFALGVRAIGTPILSSGKVIAALSVAFISEQPAERLELIRSRALAAAANMSASFAPPQNSHARIPAGAG